MKVLPFFKSHYSLGRSILTLEKPEQSKPHLADSIFDIVKDNNLDKFFLIEDSFSGFLQAHSNAKSIKSQLIFGLRLSVTDNMLEKTEDSLSKRSKIVIIAKNKAGIDKLIKIYSTAAKDGFYYEPCTDFNYLSNIWDEKELSLVVPFYDSFLHRNVLYGKNCVPNFNFCQPCFSIEDNNLPFDFLIEGRVKEYCAGKFETIRAKSIYYKSKKDYLAYLTFKCINNRTTLEKPNMDHMSSNEFCWESLVNQNKS